MRHNTQSVVEGRHCCCGRTAFRSAEDAGCQIEDSNTKPRGATDPSPPTTSAGVNHGGSGTQFVKKKENPAIHTILRRPQRACGFLLLLSTVKPGATLLEAGGKYIQSHCGASVPYYYVVVVVVVNVRVVGVVYFKRNLFPSQRVFRHTQSHDDGKSSSALYYLC